jgi:hypothetical protein
MQGATPVATACNAVTQSEAMSPRAKRNENWNRVSMLAAHADAAPSAPALRAGIPRHAAARRLGMTVKGSTSAATGEVALRRITALAPRHSHRTPALT